MSNQLAKLSCAEIGTLWSLYLNNSMSALVLKFYLDNIEDPEIREVVAHAFEVASDNESELKAAFWKEKLPLPIAFSENDINLKAPKLFSDTFKLSYVLQMARI